VFESNASVFFLKKIHVSVRKKALFQSLPSYCLLFHTSVSGGLCITAVKTGHCKETTSSCSERVFRLHKTSETMQKRKAHVRRACPDAACFKAWPHTSTRMTAQTHRLELNVLGHPQHAFWLPKIDSSKNTDEKYALVLCIGLTAARYCSGTRRPSHNRCATK
jgi:hypothetical protein